jgi:uncharacterized protein (TIGR02284 family)
MATQDWDLIGTLRRLFEASKDGDSGYRMAADHARGAELKTLFQGYAEQRARFAAELQGELERLGTQDRKTGTITETLHQGWTRIKAAVTGGSDKALIAECERAEDATRELYEEALRQDLPADVQALVRRQFAAVQEAHDRIRALEVAAP